jgi:hypothetical protein
MNNWLLALVGFVYLAVSYDYFIQHNMGMAVSFFAYSLANVGFIIANVKSFSTT